MCADCSSKNNPGFAAALELAADLVGRELSSPEMPCSIGAPEAS